MLLKLRAFFVDLDPRVKRGIMGLLALALIAMGVWAARVYGATRSLLARLPEAQALLDGNPLEADPAEVGALLHGVRDDVVTLRRNVGWLVRLGPAFGWLPQVGPLLRDAPALLELGDALTELGVLLWDDVAPAAAAFHAGGSALDAAAIALPEVAADVAAARPLADRAQAAYLEMDVTAFPQRLQGPLAKLGKVMPLLNVGLDWAEIAPSLLGLDAPRTYLLFVLNEDELRGGGGFISGVGEVQVAGGRVVGMQFSDSYTADDYSQPYPDPPAPLRFFMGLDLWVFRDSNWSPDFPTSAQQAIPLYRPDHPVVVDGVFAVDQRAAQQLVDALGPLQLPGADAPLTGETLLDYVYRSWVRAEGEEFKEWWTQRKAFMGQLAEAAMAQLTSGKVDLPRLAETALDLVAQKHLQLYFVDERAQALLAAQGWDGRLPDTAGDYLMVVESNFGYNKASAKIARAFTYQVDLTQSPPVAAVTLVYTHTSQVDIACRLEPRYDAEYVQMQDRCYWAHLRVYAPDDAQLLSASLHPMAAEHVATREPWSGVPVSELAPEGPWTVFSQAFLMPTKAHTVVTMTYTLPAEVLTATAEGEFTYHLTWPKQAGMRGAAARVVLLMPGNAVSLPAPPADTDSRGALWFSVDDDCVIAGEDGKLMCEASVVLDTDWDVAIQYRLKETEP